MIQLPNTGYPAGTIILAAGMQPRHHEFQESLANVYVPEGTVCHIVQSCDVANNFNVGVNALVGEWAWFLGDDHEFAKETLFRLLSHNVDVVVPISPCKLPLGMPFVLHGTADGGWDATLQTYSWFELSVPGLLKLPKGDFIGQAGMLVKKPVLDAIGPPWFKCGQFNKGRLQEDLWFCKELQGLGYTVWVDREIIFDHYWFMAASARRLDGKWVPCLKGANQEVILKGLERESIYSGEQRVVEET